MKKYEKPQIYFERFEMSQHVAACGYDMTNFSTKEKCTAVGDMEFGNVPITYFTETPRCQAIMNGYCYENSVDSDDAMRVFNS